MIKIISMISLLALSSSIQTQAQKLPKIQEGSVYAPLNIKIDGKTTEWNDQFQAYNLINFIYYTVSNNDNNLYLTIKMSEPYGIEKIISGGITFTVSSSDKSADAISLTYPAVTNRTGTNATFANYYALRNSAKAYNELVADPVVNKNKIAERISLSNKLVKDIYKDIQVAGIPQITDTLISVYNTQGIRTAPSFNDHMEYIYEMTIPLKYLGQDIIKAGKLRYNIKLNARPTVKLKNGIDPPIMLGPNMDPKEQYRLKPTDFSGEYTFAVKK